MEAVIVVSIGFILLGFPCRPMARSRHRCPCFCFVSGLLFGPLAVIVLTLIGRRPTKIIKVDEN